MNNVRELIDQRALADGDSVFIVDVESGEALTYKQVQIAVRQIAQYVNERGVSAGQSVAFAMNNSAHCALSVLGLFYGGYRATAINLVAGSTTIAYVLEHSEACLVLTEAKQSALLDEAFTTSGKPVPIVDIAQTLFPDGSLLNWINRIESHAQLDASSAAQSLSNAHPQTISEDTDGLLMYTSGTTGRPKGVVLTHKNLIAGGMNTAVAHQLSAQDRALCVLPLYHINGLCVTLMGPLVSAGSVVMPRRFSASNFWTWIIENQCSWFSVVPTQISYLLHAERSDAEAQLVGSNLRFGRSASAPLSPDVQRAFESRFNVCIIETMGLTETAAQILSNPLPPGVRKIGSPGIEYGDEVIIADQNLEAVANDVEGELLVRGNNVMKEYFRNPEATRSAITPQGWLRTGDLGKKDKDGYLFITGRLKELIIKGGENIAPREVDEALYQHPGVIEAAAFAIPCENYGQRVEAAVSVSSESSVTEEALLASCKKLLGDFKMPDRIYFMDELPKGPSGKIQRLKLVEQFKT